MVTRVKGHKIMRSVYSLTADEIEGIARGEIQPVYDEILELRLNNDELIAFEKAKKVGFVILKGRRHRNLHNVYYLWCGKMDRPYVAIAPKQRYASVELIMPNLPGLPEETMEKVGDLLLRETVGGGIGTVMVGQSETASSQRIPIERAEQVGKELYKIAGGEPLKGWDFEDREQHKQIGWDKFQHGKTSQEKAEGLFMVIEAHWHRNPGPRFEEYARHWLWANADNYPKEVVEILLQKYPPPKKPMIKKGYSDWGSFGNPAYKDAP
jgi:hypothetical protein